VIEEIEIPKKAFLPCYHHLLDDSQFFDIEFLYGGRDSGKSRHIAQQCVVDCLRMEYFKCLLVRKQLNTVRSSQFDLIKTVIDEWGLKDLFNYNETRLEIICKLNGNGFYGRGLDDVGKIKSFNNPSHCWIEEGNQIENTDMVVILTSLRANQNVKTWFSFNPECEKNYTDFWLWQEWFNHTKALSFTWTKTIDVSGEPVDFNIRATHTTYKDNPYCTPQRKALYESYKNSKNNAYWYQTYTLGLWGFRRTGGEFWKCFEESKHVKDINLAKGTVHIVVDNNVNPYITVDLWQIDTSKKRISQVDEIPCVHPDNTASKAAQKLCRWLRKIDYNQPVYLYGDPSANAKSTVDDNGRSFFDKFIAELKLEGFTVNNRIGRSAPEVALSGAFINEIYESNYMGWSIEVNTTCRSSIEDYVMAKEDIDGKILKKKITDPDTKVSYEKYGHHSDCKRYFITTILANEFIQYKSRRKRMGSVAVSN
jgi:phage terminase large subunit